MIIKCEYCNKEMNKSNGEINRAKKMKMSLFCNKKCFGLSKRTHKTHEEKKEEKRIYDLEYRKNNIELLRQKKSDYFKKAYVENPEKYKQIRKKQQPKHNEYCRTEKYKKYKKEYDKNNRAKLNYGEFWESSLLLKNISNIVDNREATQIKGTINKRHKRKVNIEY